MGGDASTPTASGGADSDINPHPYPLFPLFPVSSIPPLPAAAAAAAAGQWLCNPSFTLDLPAVLPGGAHAPLSEPLSPDSDAEGPPAAAPPAYDLVGSSSPSEEERRPRREERRKKKKQKKRRTSEEDDRGSSRRNLMPKPAKDYCFDFRGDPDNLAFGSLYSMDISRYKLQNNTELSGHSIQMFYRKKQSVSCEDLDEDVDVLDIKLRSGSRYCSIKSSTLERHKGFKHMKIVDMKVPPTIPGDFVPLIELQAYPENGNNGSIEKEKLDKLEESWEDDLLRKTREFNKMSRDSPHDEKVWLAFADFQDKVASKQPQKTARLQTLEKKISILEKAVDLNPDSEEILLGLLKSYQGRDSTDVLVKRWEKILMEHSDSCKLWKEYILLRQGDFSRFKVSDMRNTYGHAIQALSAACSKLCRQGCQTALSQSTDPALIHLELGLVDIFISLCRFEWQTGHQELATGLFQAEIEYSLFCPSLFLSSHNKQRLFEHFWNSCGARVGEDGSLGWSIWLEKEEHNRQNMLVEEASDEAEGGGWTGWLDLPSMKVENSKDGGKSVEHIDGDENMEENVDAEDIPLEDDIEALVKKLGIDIDSEPHSEVKDTATWSRWSVMELTRDSEQWMPVHKHSGDSGELMSLNPSGNSDRESDEQLSRIILFEDVSDYLFSLCSEEARFSLVSQFIDFYGGKISQWTCTNSPSWIEKILSVETMHDSILDLKLFSDIHSSSSHMSMEFLSESINDLSRKITMMKFLRNAILLCLNAFQRNYKLEEALLFAEEMFMTKMNSSTCSVNPSRALAKSLLKNDRQDLLLCGLYARSEAAYGNTDLARKIFDMALSSTDGLPLDIQLNVPLLYFWYAEMEMAGSTSGSSPESTQRAVHILSCLGGNVKYTPFNNQPSGLQLLRARQGYKEQIKGLRFAWARGDVRESSIALISSASLFEALTTGWSAGIEIIKDAFSLALPERRSRSSELEFLWIYYIGFLQKHIKQLKFSRVWETILHGLQIYPYNPQTFISMLKVGSLFAVPNKVRRAFDECTQRKPSVIVWIYALLYELFRTGSQHRIHSLFERALADDKTQKSVLMWRCYLAYEVDIAHNHSAAKRVFFRAIHACPWSKRLWLDGFQKLCSILSTKELSDLQEVMRDKELNLRTDIYEILLQDEIES